MLKNLAKKVKEMFDESDRVSHESLQNQISYIDKNVKNPVLNEIYKADVISRTMEGKPLFADYM